MYTGLLDRERGETRTSGLQFSKSQLGSTTRVCGDEW